MSKMVTQIAQYRQSTHIKQDELATMVGVRRETINRLEKGQYNPSLKLAHDIAKVFGVPIEKLFTFEDDIKK